MGIQRSDWDWFGNVTTEAFEGPDEEFRSVAHGEIFLYFAELLAERTANPGRDFISLSPRPSYERGHLSGPPAVR
jgi:hypothetical protein